ncbi:MAG: hypothetical protein WBG73_01320 [Coleofasciculaceae cyanobacterium]
MPSLLDSCIALEEIYSQSLCSRQISRSQIQEIRLLETLFSLQPQQNRLIKRLLHASRRGWISITD